MLDGSQLALFVGACLALLLAPGPAVLYIVARGLQEGRAAAFASVVGVECASLVHVAAAVVGLSALLASSAEAYTIIRFAGAAYLIWLGLRTILGDHSARGDADAVPSKGRAFRQGFIVNLLNPKTALFFLAFLPQFTDPTRGSVELQVLVLGMTWVCLATLTDGMYALLSARARTSLHGLRSAERAQRWFSGVTYVTLGAVTLTAEGPNRD